LPCTLAPQFRIRWPRAWFVDSSSGSALSTTDILGAVPWEPIHFYVRLRRLPDQRHQRQPSYFTSSQFVDVFAAERSSVVSPPELQPSQPPVPLRRKHSRTVSGLPESFAAAGLQLPSAAINMAASAPGRRKLPAMGFMVVVGDEGFERKLFLRGDVDDETEIVATSPLAARASIAVDFTFDLRGALQRLIERKQSEHGSVSSSSELHDIVVNARSVSLLVIPYCLVPGQCGSFVLRYRAVSQSSIASAYIWQSYYCNSHSDSSQTTDGSNIEQYFDIFSKKVVSLNTLFLFFLTPPLRECPLHSHCPSRSALAQRALGSSRRVSD
jgi:hypothetical protein